MSQQFIEGLFIPYLLFSPQTVVHNLAERCLSYGKLFYLHVASSVLISSMDEMIDIVWQMGMMGQNLNMQVTSPCIYYQF